MTSAVTEVAGAGSMGLKMKLASSVHLRKSNTSLSDMLEKHSEACFLLVRFDAADFFAR